MTDPTISIARKAYQAYVDKDRAAIEAVIGNDFQFTSPLIIASIVKPTLTGAGRTAKRSRTLPFINLVGDGERVFVTYEGQSATGKRFRNTEIMTVWKDKIVEVEVYFGWPVPHADPVGGFVDA